MKSISVLIADDHAVVRDGLRALLEAHPDIAVVGDAADGLEAVRQVEELQPDIVIMDIHMPAQRDRSHQQIPSARRRCA
jgi:DNA-binding NarL/FixJ family response regulator